MRFGAEKRRSTFVSFSGVQGAQALARELIQEPELLHPSIMYRLFGRDPDVAAMVNILGDAWAHGEPDWRKVLSHPRAKLHLYGKSQARAGRKMGHFTVIGDNAEAVQKAALAARAAIGIKDE